MRGNLKDIYNFDDLIFKSRNKDYGAYQLRKRYKSVLTTSIIVSSLLFSSAVILPFIRNGCSDKVITSGLYSVQFKMENLEPPLEEIIIPPSLPPPPEPASIQEVVKYVPPVVVDTIIPFESPHATVDEILSQSPNDLIDISGKGSGGDLILGQDGWVTDDPFVLVDVMPSFRGGDIGKFRDWVSKRTYYPLEAINSKIYGTVYLTFIIEKDGSVSNVTIWKSVHPLLDSEAVRVISESPKWNPGLQRGQPVRVRYSISLFFAPN